jgi:hypothetical protein
VGEQRHKQQSEWTSPKCGALQHQFVFGRFVTIGAIILPCASAAKLQGAGGAPSPRLKDEVRSPQKSQRPEITRLLFEPTLTCEPCEKNGRSSLPAMPCGGKMSTRVDHGLQGPYRGRLCYRRKMSR